MNPKKTQGLSSFCVTRYQWGRYFYPYVVAGEWKRVKLRQSPTVDAASNRVAGCSPIEPAGRITSNPRGWRATRVSLHHWFATANANPVEVAHDSIFRGRIPHNCNKLSTLEAYRHAKTALRPDFLTIPGPSPDASGQRSEGGSDRGQGEPTSVKQNRHG